MNELVFLILLLFSISLLCLLVPDQKVNSTLSKGQEAVFDRIEKKVRSEKKKKVEMHISTRV
jgi:hypothetical protein